MAIRTPLKIDSTNLKEMSSTDTTNIISRMVYKYFTDPSVTLTSVGSGGTAMCCTESRSRSERS